MGVPLVQQDVGVQQTVACSPDDGSNAGLNLMPSNLNKTHTTTSVDSFGYSRHSYLVHPTLDTFPVTAP